MHLPHGTAYTYTFKLLLVSFVTCRALLDPRGDRGHAHRDSHGDGEPWLDSLCDEANI